MMTRRLLQSLALTAVLSAWSGTAARATQVTNYHNDLSNSGLNSTETALTPANVVAGTFAKRFSTTVDGKVYAQPLYMPNITVTGGAYPGVHNLVFVATQHDTLFAIDANSGVIVWQTSFTASGLPGATITSVPSGDVNSSDTAPEIGVCGTPVIDPTTNLIYVAAKTKQVVNGVFNYVYTLYKIDITNGAANNANIVASTVIGDTIYNTSTQAFTFHTAASPTAPQDIFVPGTGDGAITVNGQSRVYFNTLRQMNRPGMTLSNGTLFIAFGSHGDNGPYHGWLLAYSASTLTLTGVFNSTPNAGLGGFWGGGAAPAVDANGYIYLMTGNGLFDGYNNNGVAAGLDSLGFPVNGDYGDSVLKIAVDPTTSVGNQNKNGWGLRLVDYFTPFNSLSLQNSDTDLGSGGVTILPDSAGSSAHPHLLVGAGKQGNLYMIDRDNMGKFSATTDNVVQSQTVIDETFNTQSFFNGVLYCATVNDHLKSLPVANAVMATTPGLSPDSEGWPGSTAAISANGTTNGIVWLVDNQTSQLRAYLASNVSKELYTSGQVAGDALGSSQKFAAPTVADGQVFVPTGTALVVYGLPVTTASAPAAPTALSATAVSGLQINLNWTDNSTNENGFAIEQSTDGVNFTQIATVGVNITNYVSNSGLASGTTYYYRVRAYNGTGNATFSAYTNIASATTTGTIPSLNFSSGFVGSNGALVYNGNAKIVNSRAELTDGGYNEDSTIFSATTQNIAKFSTQFTFQLTNASADGFSFIIQNNTPNSIGRGGGDLGYAGIINSIAVKFDIYSNVGEGNDSTGLFTNGVDPYTPSTDLTSSGIKLNSGDVMSVSLIYDGATLTETITDTVTNATKTLTYSINIPTTIGSNTAYVGFGGGTGGLSAVSDILTWSFAPLPTTIPVAPTNLVATAVSGTQANLTWTDNSNNESGFIVLRSTNGGAYAQAGVTAAGATTYSDSTLTPGTTYSYEVEATNSVGTSAPTNVATVLMPTPPLTPTNAQPTAITQTSISMSWTNNATNAIGYNILRKATTASNFTQIAQLPATATTYTDAGPLTPGTSYDYHIQAYNVAGYSDFSGFTAVTLGNTTPPVISVSVTGPAAVNGIATGQVTFTSNTPVGTALPISYTVSGSAVAGTDYTALSGTATIPVGGTSVVVPITAAANATPNSTVTVSIATTTAYTAGSPASGTVVLQGTTINPSAQNGTPTVSISGAAGTNVTLTYPGLPGSPNGAVYVWYYLAANGAFAVTTTPSYTFVNPLASQSGAYGVYAWAPGSGNAITGLATYVVTITPPPITVTASTPALQVNDGSSNTFTVSLSSAPAANTTVNLSIVGTPSLTVSPATITMTPTAYQNQTVTVTASALNSNDAARSATVTAATSSSSTTVAVTDVISDTQTAANLAGTTTPLTGSNIGTGSAGDSSVHTSGAWWVDGSGAGGISGTADAFHFESQSVTGNFTMIVQLQNLVAYGATTPRAGLMIRDGTAAGSNFLALAGNAASSGGYDLDSRTTLNGASSETVTTGAGLTYTYPNAWMMLTRVGSVLHAFVSSNGTTYTEVTNPATGVTWTGISSSLSIGLFSSSGSAANTRAVVSNFSITLPAPTGLTLTDIDLGAPGLAGSATFNAGVYSVSGGGSDIWGTLDQCNFDYTTSSGDNTMIVQVNAIQNTDAWAKGGIMFRNSLSGGSAYFGVFTTGGYGVAVQYRDTDGSNAVQPSLTGGIHAPNWLKLVRAGTTMTAYYATTTGTPGTTDWILVATHTVPYGSTSYLSGLAVTAHNNTLIGTDTFANLTIGSAASPPPPPPPPPPTTPTDADIGTPPIAGSATVSGTTYTLSGCGSDIWGNADQFNFDSIASTGDATMIVQVSSIQNTNAWAKGGIMFRNSLSAGSSYFGIFTTGGYGVAVQYRDTDGSNAVQPSLTGGVHAPNWLKIQRVGTTMTAYYATTTVTPASTDWILVCTHTVPYASTSYYSGMAACSHNTAALGTDVFNNFSLTFP